MPFEKNKSIYTYLFKSVREYIRRRKERRQTERGGGKNFGTYGVLLTTNQQTVGDWGRGRQVGSSQS